MACFHPGLASTRDGSFGVGDKAAQKRFGTFAEALEHLRSMETAKWRSPILAATGVSHQRLAGQTEKVAWRKFMNFHAVWMNSIH